jgi:ATP-dependent RNA/DNA helicase IGHMBP2
MYFQGREKECVILSLVRSNPEGEVGFLAERRRLNVAVTRARRQVTVICDSETVRRDAFLAEFLDYMEKHGTLESASLHEDELPPIVRPKDVSSASLSSLKEKAGKGAAGGGSASGKIKKERDSKVAKKKTENVKRINTAKNTETFVPKKVLDPAAAQVKQDLAESLKDNLMVQVEAFLACESDIFKFPCELTAQERFLVHEIAEELGLIHESVGEAKTRHIVLTKPPSSGEKTKAEETVQQEIPGLSAASGISPPLQLPVNTPMVLCNNCQKSVAKANMELHKLRCQVQLAATAVISTVSQSSSCAVPTKKKKSAPVKKLPGASKNDDIEDFDALCEQFQTLNRVCNYEKCKTKTAVLGADCVHCRVRFCLSHALAEIHGCGEAAKLAARQQLFRLVPILECTVLINSVLDPYSFDTDPDPAF